MELNVNLPLGLTSSLPVEIGEVSPISQEDLNLLKLRRPESGARAPLRSIRQSHHMLARLLADDVAIVDISAMMGYSPSHIRILQEDPSIQELVTHYRARIEMEKADLHTQVQAVAQAALQELTNRLDDPERAGEISESTLVKIMESGLDRTGYGPTSKVDVRVTDISKIIENLKSQQQAEISRVISREEVDDTTFIEGSDFCQDFEERAISKKTA